MKREILEVLIPPIEAGAHQYAMQVERRQRQLVVVEEYARSGNLAGACGIAGVSVFTHYYWAKHHVAYREAYEKARRALADRLEGSVYERALNGTVRPIFSQGEKVGEWRDYNPIREMAVLKGMKPEVYGSKSEVIFKHQSEGELTAKIRELCEKAGIEWDGKAESLVGGAGDGSGSVESIGACDVGGDGGGVEGEASVGDVGPDGGGEEVCGGDTGGGV